MQLPAAFQRFDGSGRTPRDAQVEVLNWIWANKDKPRLALQLPTGIGKSAIFKALQLTAKGHIVVPSNVLLDQYYKDYPQTNFIKGKEHYVCQTNNMHCVDVVDLGLKCDSCILTGCKKRAREGEPTIFNPISKYYAEQAESKMPATRVALVDEAHRLLDTLELLISEEFSHTRYQYPAGLGLQNIGPWLEKIADDLDRVADAYKIEPKKSQKARLRALSLRRLKARVWASPDDFCVYETTKVVQKKEERYLCIRPINVPRFLVNACLGEVQQTILMSATLTRTKAQEVFGTSDFAYLDLDSPIPTENRPVILDYQGFTSKTPASEIAAWIRKQMQLHPGNTMVHVTYGMGRELSYFIPEAIYHQGAHDKDDALKRFKHDGGIWLAAGCAEGIDLPGDYCRLNLIPVLPYANVGDPVVAARIKRHGNAQYERQTILTLIQQVGRSTRGITDKSVCVVGDGRMAKLFNKHRKDIPRSFWSAIKW